EKMHTYASLNKLSTYETGMVSAGNEVLATGNLIEQEEIDLLAIGKTDENGSLPKDILQQVPIPLLVY
ncbi:MAG: hypothetical protein AAGI38_22800, partial [Bacteroidota bacterium]